MTLIVKSDHGEEGTDYLIDEEVEMVLMATADVRVWESELDKFTVYELLRQSDMEVDTVSKEKTGRTRKLDWHGHPLPKLVEKVSYEASCPKCGTVETPLDTGHRKGWLYLTFNCPEHGMWYEKVPGGIK